METLFFEITEDHVGLRLDKALAELCEGFSRARLQGLIKQGQVQRGGIVADNASLKLALGDQISICVPDPVDAEPQPQDIPLDIVYEDDDMLVINKPAGLVVHPGAGNHDGTLVNALLYHCGESLSGIGGVLRPGVVHRLDKETSGLMVVAKSDRAHQGLSAQLADRSLSRIYQALVLGVPMPRKGVIDKPLGRDLKNRLKMAVTAKNSKEAVTRYRILEEYSGVLSLVECSLQTGRTHQIRVHMASEKHPLIGDPLYGPQPTALQAALKRGGYDDVSTAGFLEFPRQALHAKSISFIHPCTNEEFSFESDLPEDFSKLLNYMQ